MRTVLIFLLLASPASAQSWRFGVAGDSRNCGDVIMPAMDGPSLARKLREARPNSRWAKKETNQYWFEEGALVDLYLAENGY